MSGTYLPEDAELRKRAEQRLTARRDFAAHLLAYVLVNLGLVLVWWWTNPDGFFWPIFPVLGWGIGLAFHAFDVFFPGPSEDRIQAEMERIRRQGA